MSVTYPNLAYWTIAQTRRVVPLAIDKPGRGKSASVQAFLHKLGYDCVTVEGSIHDPTDFGFPSPRDVTLTHPDGSQETFRIMEMLIPDFMFEAIKNPLTGIFLDELGSIAEQVQTAMMGFMHERRIGNRRLADTALVMAAANPVTYAANGHDFAIPLVTRMAHLPWEFDWGAWEIGMGNGGHFPEPNFVPLPEDWERHIPWATGRINAFLKSQPALKDTTPAEEDPDFRVKAVQPYANPRSWFNAGVCRAACIAVDADPLVQIQAMRGCVGDAVTQQFTAWESALDLPDPEVVLQDAMEAVRQGKDPAFEVPVRSDLAMASLSGLVDRALNHGLENNLPSVARWEGCAAIFNVASRNGSLEYVVATAGPLMGTAAKINANPPAELIERLFPVLKRCGLIGNRT